MEQLQYICSYCSKDSWKSKRGLSQHETYCVSNPNAKKAVKKTEAFYEAMKARRGRSTNGWTYVNWDLVPFEKLGFSKKRSRLIQLANYSCTSCGFNKTRECGGSILEIDHIDGNHNNNSLENLRVLCPNCHALTPNFRNWGRSSKMKSSTRIRRSTSRPQAK